MTLCFSDKGPYLLEDETFAEHFGERFREQIRHNAELAAFLEEANSKAK